MDTDAAVVADRGWEFSEAGEGGLRDAEVIRRWERLGGDGYWQTLGERVSRRVTPLQAWIDYRREDPKARFDDDFGPFHDFSERLKSAVSADEAKLYCSDGGTLESCNRWYLWARFGQYLVQLAYVGNADISLEEFITYVNSINDAVDAAT